MKVAKVRSLDAHDRKRFVELTPQVDVDAAREAEYLAAVFNMGFVRQSWRTVRRRKRRNRS